MTTITGTPFEKLAASLSPAMQQRDMEDYLTSFLPDLSTGLAQMSLERPHDPYAYLARYLLSKSKVTGVIPQLDAYLESSTIPAAVVRDKVGIFEEKTKAAAIPSPSPKSSKRTLNPVIEKSSSSSSSSSHVQTKTSNTTSNTNINQTNHPLRIIIAGAACSGKGTQCERIKQQYGVVHISTGDLLRENVAAGTELGQTAKSFMDTGRLVPDELLIGIVRERLKQEDCMKHGWLLDGFPRSPGQAEALINAGITPDVFIVLNVPDSVLIERVTGRRLDPETGMIYHVKFDPAPESIQSRLIQRSDDTEEKISVRLQGYHSYVSAIESHFTTILKPLDGNRGKDVVYKDISNILDDIVQKKRQ